MTWQLQGQSRKEGGDRDKQAAGGEAVAGGGDELKVAAGDAMLLSQLHHRLTVTSASTFPSLSFPTYKIEMILASGDGHFNFYHLPPFTYFQDCP